MQARNVYSSATQAGTKFAKRLDRHITQFVVPLAESRGHEVSKGRDRTFHP
jgi:hypothetical protein